ncbi:MAG: SDR family NAD(P)-dependent oxidoreductase [Mesorhizobium sp.]|nr:MAG: SDR family NAD(P)-dependent oxidoreductase [Mesorhizobium sp.]
MTDIEKKTAVITGAAGGIGQAISRQFVANGYRVGAGDADQAGLDRLEAELNRTGQTVWSRAGDLRNKAYCEAPIDYSIRATGLTGRARQQRRHHHPRKHPRDDRRALGADVRHQSDVDFLHVPACHRTHERPRRRCYRQRLIVLGSLSRTGPCGLLYQQSRGRFFLKMSRPGSCA